MAPDTLAHPLAGLRVVEVSSYVAAPLGGMTLAQLGAEVVRVDQPGGGPDYRRWPLADSGTSLYWAGLNKAKHSVTVELRSPAGRELVARLVTESGPGGAIVLTNSAGQSWLSYEALRAARPDVIVVNVMGRRDGSSAVDYTVNAAVGFPQVTGPEGHDGPVNHVLPAWDVACGLYAAVGLLAAERRRRVDGVGTQIDLTLEDVALATAGNLGLLAEAQLGRHRERIGNYLYGGFGRDFAARDGQVMVVTLTTRHWRELAEATGLAGVLTGVESALDTDFGTDAGRFEHREVIAALLAPWFAARSMAEIAAVLSQTSVLWAPYRSFNDVVADGQAELRANPMMGEVVQPGVGTYLAPASPLAIAGLRRDPAPAPALGEHTDTVLRAWLGLDDDQLAGLRREGVIGHLDQEG